MNMTLAVIQMTIIFYVVTCTLITVCKKEFLESKMGENESKMGEWEKQNR